MFQSLIGIYVGFNSLLQQKPAMHWFRWFQSLIGIYVGFNERRLKFLLDFEIEFVSIPHRDLCWFQRQWNRAHRYT